MSLDTTKSIRSVKYNGVNIPLEGITPSGKKLITDTSETDVAAFATAQISSDTLLAENIKKDVNILGVVGSFEGGGSSSPYLMTLLHDLTITEDVHSITTSWNNAWFDYDILLVEFDVTLSGATYIDFNVNGVSTSGNNYTAKSANQAFRQTCINLDGRTYSSYTADSGVVSFFSPYWSSPAKAGISKDTLVSLDWVCDTASVNFVSGTVKVFGGKMV